MNNKPLVSIAMITYNQELYIEEAINSVLMQKTDFDYELIIANDCSSDQTHEIIEKYIKNYTGKHTIRYFSNKINKGLMNNFIFSLQQTCSKYIAICEGDDYWTDSNKLQKQVDFLNNNQDYSLCIHDGLIYQEEKQKFKDFCISDNEIIDNCQLKTEYVFKCRGVMAPTASFVFHSKYLTPQSFEFIKNSPAGDFAVILIMVLNGKIGIIREKMSVYRVSASNGSWTSSMAKNIEIRLNFAQKREAVWHEFDRISGGKYSALVKQAISIQYSTYINGLGHLTTKIDQLKALIKYKEKLLINDYVYLVPRIFFRKNKFV